MVLLLSSHDLLAFILCPNAIALKGVTVSMVDGVQNRYFICKLVYITIIV